MGNGRSTRSGYPSSGHRTRTPTRHADGTLYFNLKEVAFTFTDEEDIPDNVPKFYDDYGNEIDKEEFIQKYPAVICKAKEFAKTLK